MGRVSAFHRANSIFAILSLVMCMKTLAQCPPNFGSAGIYIPGNSIFAVADLNNDTNSDFVYCIFGSIVGAYLGDGDGTFTWAGHSQNGNGANALAVGDLNGDGFVDLATANYSGDNISIILGDGDGTFQPAVYLPAGDRPESIAIDDLNGDAKLDLVVGYITNDNIDVFLGNGDGSFQSPVNHVLTSAVWDVATADMNNDGIPDVVIPASSRIIVLLGNGDGTLQAGIDSPVVLGNSYQDVALGDLNGDGRLDVATTNRNGFNLRVFLGNGDGTLQTPLSSTVCSGCFLYETALADVNGDARLDAIVGALGPTISTINVLLGNGNGTFQAAVPFAGVTGSPTTERGISTADFNNDNRPEVISSGDSGVAIMFNTGSCIGFSPQPISQSVASGQNAMFTVGAVGSGPFTYQWRRNGVSISNGGHFSGARTSTLTVSNVTLSEIGAYDVVVTGGCNGAIGSTSKLAMLNLQVCKGDFNSDNQFDGADIQGIVDALLAGESCP